MRTAAGFSQSVMAEKCGVGRWRIALYELDRGGLETEHKRRIASVFEVVLGLGSAIKLFPELALDSNPAHGGPVSSRPETAPSDES